MRNQPGNPLSSIIALFTSSPSQATALYIATRASTPCPPPRTLPTILALQTTTSPPVSMEYPASNVTFCPAPDLSSRCMSVACSKKRRFCPWTPSAVLPASVHTCLSVPKTMIWSCQKGVDSIIVAPFSYPVSYLIFKRLIWSTAESCRDVVSILPMIASKGGGRERRGGSQAFARHFEASGYCQRVRPFLGEPRLILDESVTAIKYKKSHRTSRT